MRAPPPAEDLLALDAIQGNVLAGFSKDHQRLVFLRLADRAAAKRWLAALVPRIATTREVLAYNRLFRTLKARRGEDPQGFVATWINVAFSWHGLARLTSPAVAARFADAPFRAGLAARSAALGDPVDPRDTGHPSHWVVGGPGGETDLVVIVASDDGDECDAQADAIVDALLVGRRRAADVVWDQRGQTLPGVQAGREHFGFRDGISQPGVRGRLSVRPGDFLTPRLLPRDDPAADDFGKPGQPLVWPGQFVLGYRRQRTDDAVRPAPPRRPAPAWSRDGAYVVIRRLEQDVAGFWRFALERAGEIARLPGFAGVSAEHVAALMVGRWKSGAPIVLAPRHDDPALAADPMRNNRFGYADAAGAECPHAAHVRRMNPRDEPPAAAAAAALARLPLRRGIPYGPPLANPFAPTRAEARTPRGLVYVAYQASIGAQFEALSAQANAGAAPDAGGADALIGQQTDAAGRRVRVVELVGRGGRVAALTLPRDWIHPTGGGYFFAPSLPALAAVLAT